MEKPAAFVAKLHFLLSLDQSESFMHWNQDGSSFIITDTIEFTKTLLAKHFRHSNMASFVRQLNKYDFHKIKTTMMEDGTQSWEFSHSKFHRDNSDWHSIKRKEVSIVKIKEEQQEEEFEVPERKMMEEHEQMKRTIYDLQLQLDSLRSQFHNFQMHHQYPHASFNGNYRDSNAHPNPSWQNATSPKQHQPDPNEQFTHHLGYNNLTYHQKIVDGYSFNRLPIRPEFYEPHQQIHNQKRVKIDPLKQSVIKVPNAAASAEFHHLNSANSQRFYNPSQQLPVHHQQVFYHPQSVSYFLPHHSRPVYSTTSDSQHPSAENNDAASCRNEGF